MRLLDRRRPAPRRSDGAPGHFGEHGYITDGRDLYRVLGWGMAGDFLQLEDCRSLELVIVPTRELHGRWLMPVTPAPAA